MPQRAHSGEGEIQMPGSVAVEEGRACSYLRRAADNPSHCSTSLSLSAIAVFSGRAKVAQTRHKQCYALVLEHWCYHKRGGMRL